MNIKAFVCKKESKMKRINCILFVVCFLIMGCDQEVLTELKVIEFINLSNGHEIYKDSVILYEISSEKEFHKSKHAVHDLFSGYFKVKDVKFNKSSFKNFMCISVEIPITNNEFPKQANTLFYFSVQKNTLYSTIDPLAMNKFRGDVSNLYSLNDRIDLRNIAFKIFLTNDLDNNISLRHYSQFYDGYGISVFLDRELDKHQKVSIELSNTAVSEMEFIHVPILSWKKTN
jgi:hypothetical protein